MTITEIQEFRTKLEKDIGELADDFETATGMEVSISSYHSKVNGCHIVSATVLIPKPVEKTEAANA